MLTRGNSPSALSSESQLMSLKINTRHATPKLGKTQFTRRRKRRPTKRSADSPQRKPSSREEGKEDLRKEAQIYRKEAHLRAEEGEGGRCQEGMAEEDRCRRDPAQSLSAIKLRNEKKKAKVAAAKKEWLRKIAAGEIQ